MHRSYRWDIEGPKCAIELIVVISSIIALNRVSLPRFAHNPHSSNAI